MHVYKISGLDFQFIQARQGQERVETRLNARVWADLAWYNAVVESRISDLRGSGWIRGWEQVLRWFKACAIKKWWII